MDTPQFDEQIQNFQKKVESIRSEMNTAKPEIISATQNFLESWIKDRVEKEVKSKPYITKSLGIDRLKNLKSELNNYLENVKELVDKEFNESSIWFQDSEFNLQNLNQIEQVQHYQKHFSNELKKIIYKLIRFTGSLLKNYGYVEFSYNGEWKDNHNKEPEYGYAITYNDELNQVIKNFNELIMRYVTNQIEIKTIERQKLDFEVQNLWDEA